jgi:hypothetical protein
VPSEGDAVLDVELVGEGSSYATPDHADPDDSRF